MTEPTTQAQGDEPLNQFTNCHGGILRRLNMLDELPGLLGPAARARLIAEQALSFFREAIFEHHLEEERELFPAVIASAQPGACLLYTSPSPRDKRQSRMPSSA